MITRVELGKVVSDAYANPEQFFEDVRYGDVDSFSIFSSIDEAISDANVMILDSETNLFISWYKLQHLGRDLHSNIPDTDTLRDFIMRFKNCEREVSR